MLDKLSMTQIRKALELNQEAFGKPAGLSREQVARRESSEVRWSLDEVYLICEAFGIDSGKLSLKP